MYKTIKAKLPCGAGTRNSKEGQESDEMVAGRDGAYSS